MDLVSIFKSTNELGLVLNSFVESFFLVPPPDFLLIAMDLANPNKALYYAFICTIASTLGGVVGWLIGRIGGRPIFNWLFRNKKDQFNKVEELYNKYGSIAVLFAAFTPIPYKVFTIASGILNMPIIKFIIASFIGRGLRFFIVSIVLMLFGESIKKYIELVILAVTILIILFFVILYKKSKRKNDKKIEIEKEKIKINLD